MPIRVPVTGADRTWHYPGEGRARCVRPALPIRTNRGTQTIGGIDAWLPWQHATSTDIDQRLNQAGTDIQSWPTGHSSPTERAITWKTNADWPLTRTKRNAGSICLAAWRRWITYSSAKTTTELLSNRLKGRQGLQNKDTLVHTAPHGHPDRVGQTEDVAQFINGCSPSLEAIATAMC